MLCLALASETCERRWLRAHGGRRGYIQARRQVTAGQTAAFFASKDIGGAPSARAVKEDTNALQRPFTNALQRANLHAADSGFARSACSHAFKLG